jgi:hypothetical protein
MCICKHSKEAHYDDFMSDEEPSDAAVLGACFFSYNCDCKEYKDTGE